MHGPVYPASEARASLDVALGAAVRATTTIKKGETLPHILVEDGSKGLNYIAAPICQAHLCIAGHGLRAYC